MLTIKSLTGSNAHPLRLQADDAGVALLGKQLIGHKHRKLQQPVWQCHTGRVAIVPPLLKHINCVQLNATDSTPTATYSTPTCFMPLG
jgi:hypothetical protein